VQAQGTWGNLATCTGVGYLCDQGWHGVCWHHCGSGCTAACTPLHVHITGERVSVTAGCGCVAIVSPRRWHKVSAAPRVCILQDYRALLLAIYLTLFWKQVNSPCS